MFDTIPAALNPNATGYLVYNSTGSLPSANTVDQLNPIDDFVLVPSDGVGILDKVDHQITLDVKMDNLDDGAN
jgi:iron transport multicopper oxidase